MFKARERAEARPFHVIIVTTALLAAAIQLAPPALAAPPVSGPTTLYFHSTPTGVGDADVLFVNGSKMDTTAPTKSTPSAWYSTPIVGNTNPNTVVDANWRWFPVEGFSFSGVNVKVTFWAISPGGPLAVNGWNVSLYNGNKLIAFRPGGGDFEPTQAGAIARYDWTFNGLTFAGQTLTIQIHPFYLDVDWAHAILYDSTGFPSGVAITSAADTTPPSQVNNLTVGNATANSLRLAWSPAADNVGVDHYKVYRGTESGNLSFATNAPASPFTDTGLSPSTTYFYQVSAVDAAGNEGNRSGEANGTTAPPDTAPPVISGVVAEPAATLIVFRWTTDEATTGLLEVGTTTSYGRSFTTPLGTAHSVTVTGLPPGTLHHYRVNATDGSGNSANSGDVTTTTASTQTMWLHSKGAASTLSMNEFNETNDNNQSGFNLLGAALATVNHQSGQEAPLFGAIRQVFPAANPPNPSEVIDTGQNVEATIYVRFPTAVPTAGTLFGQSVGVVSLRLTLLANANEVVGTQVIDRIVVLDDGFVPFSFSFAPALSTVQAGSLKAEIRADKSTTAYVIGYQGASASNLRIPLEPVAPLGAAGSVATVGKLMEDASLSFSGSASGGVPPYSFSWEFSDGGSAGGAAASHAFTTPGVKAATLTATDSLGAQANHTFALRVLQRDFVTQARVVVAVIDTGINPYHEIYSRPGIELPLGSFLNASDGALPQVLDLTFGASYAANVLADDPIWDNVSRAELVYFNGTNALGISWLNSLPAGGGVLDKGGHGTNTTSTVLKNYPDATIVMAQCDASLFSASCTNAFKWAVEQPWIDVISGSLGVPGNVPEPIFVYPIAEQQAISWAAGKVWVESSGNDPQPVPVDGFDGSPFALSITGSQQGGKGKEILSTYLYPDFASNYTVTGANHKQTTGYATTGGTSFSCPTVAGTVAGVIHSLRAAAGYTGSISGGDLVPSTGVDNVFLRHALNKTARYDTLPDSGYAAGINFNGDHGLPPFAPWLAVGWGHLDGTMIPDVVATVNSGDVSLPAPPDEKGLAKIYMEGTYAARAAYWGPFGSPSTFLASVSMPGPGVNVVAITPVETPHPYAPNSDLASTVSVPGAAAISLHFEDFAVETGFDFVQIETPSGEVLATLSMDGGADFWTPYFPGDSVVVRLLSDTAVERYGFRVAEVDAPMPP